MDVTRVHDGAEAQRLEGSSPIRLANSAQEEVSGGSVVDGVVDGVQGGGGRGPSGRVARPPRLLDQQNYYTSISINDAVLVSYNIHTI